MSEGKGDSASNETSDTAPKKKGGLGRLIKRLLITFVVLVLLAVIGLVVAGFLMHQPRPASGDAASGTARLGDLNQATGLEAYERLGALEWTFAGRHTHLWDRERNAVRVSYPSGRKVYVHLHSQTGRVFDGGSEVLRQERKDAVRQAYEEWTNDSFWLNPIAKMQEGTAVSVVGRDLRVEYTGDGGVTPGDCYVWKLGGDGLPVSWQMWVSIIPIGGVSATWEDWIDLPGGAKVATKHKMGPMTLELTDVRAAATMSELYAEEDPLAAIFE